MSRYLKYVGLILVGAAWALEFSGMSPDRIVLQVGMVAIGIFVFIENFQKDIVEAITLNLRHTLATRPPASRDDRTGN